MVHKLRCLKTKIFSSTVLKPGTSMRLLRVFGYYKVWIGQAFLIDMWPYKKKAFVHTG